MRILVTAASGTVGSLVVDRLLQAKVRVRALSRDPARHAFPEGVETVAGDFSRPETLTGAFEDIDAVFLFTWTETAEEIVRRMREAGVRRVVLLSSSSVEDEGDGAEGNLGHRIHRPVEYAVERSGMEWTHVRAGEFMVNDLDSYPDSIRAEGVIRAPNGDEPGAPVHEADIADVAAAALVEDGHHGRAYELTGPEAITPAQRTALIAEVLGREINFVPLTTEQARELWISQGVPPQVCDWLLWEPDPALTGADWDPSEIISPDYERVMGRPGRGYAQFLADHLDAFR